MKTIRVLQLGETDLSTLMPISDCAEWHYEPDFSELPEKDFDIAILDREITGDELEYLVRFLRAYTLFITENVPLEKDSPTQQLLVRKRGKQISAEKLQTLLEEELLDYFSGFSGDHFWPYHLSVAQGFLGNVLWRGFEGVDLSGDFGDKMTQIVFWTINPSIEGNQTIEFWLEYAKDATIEISLEITILYFLYGTDPESQKTWTFSEKDLEDIIYIENKNKRRGIMFASLRAKGKGTLTVTAIHSRNSRRGKGIFLPGGKRSITSDREEVFYYFDPGNLKPPLNVYFAGFHLQEGFEGYKMMRKIGHPFLLIAEARLEGGAFYMGSEEYENIIEQIIRNHIKELGVQNSEVIMSGLSMGAFGALFYSCRIQPHTILIGKPLASLGDIAENERMNRPGGFPASLDVLHKFCGSLSHEAASQLNDRFWNAFDQTDWSGVQFAVSYMLEDDFENTAYGRLQSHLKGSNVRIYGKGLHGRHNDDTPGIVSWFVSQYHRIVQDYFDNALGETGGRK